MDTAVFEPESDPRLFQLILLYSTRKTSIDPIIFDQYPSQISSQLSQKTQT